MCERRYNSSFQNDVLFQALSLKEFITIMDQYNYPFTVDKSYIADFFIFGTTSSRDLKIMMCIPDCFTVAEKYLMDQFPSFINDIHTDNNPQAIRFKEMNYRDILIEGFNMIYVNYWNIHTSKPVGDVQKLALMKLVDYGYVNSDLIYSNSVIYHTHIMDNMVIEGKAVKLHYKEERAPRYYVSFSALSNEAKSCVIATDSYHKFSKRKEIPNLIDNFYFMDSSNHMIDFITSKDIENMKRRIGE